MNKQQFNNMMASLDARKVACKNYLDGINTTDDLSRLTLAKAAELKNFCIQEENAMTNIVMVDLYHVIGMGDLTPPQMMQFTYSIKEYLEYRPTIKALVKSLDSIMCLPKIPVKTQYKLQGLGGFTLTHGDGPIVDETNTSCELIKGDSDLPFTLEGRTIRVDLTRLDQFAAVAQTIAKSNILRDRLKLNITSMKECLGILWSSVSDTEAVGTFKTGDNNMYNRFVSYYNKRKMDC
jgi:hypothetical protein